MGFTKKPETEAKEVIAERLKGYNTSNGVLFKLKNRREVYIKPKFTFDTPSGQKCKVRYLRDEGSIFVSDQIDVPDDVTLEMIGISQHLVANSKNLQEFLVLNKAFNKVYEIHDPEQIARLEEEKTEAFDSVWYKVREKKREDLKALYMLASGAKISDLKDLSTSEMKMDLRHITEKDPEKMREYLESRLLRPLYLYHYSMEMGDIKLDALTNDIVWTDSKKKICTVPVDADPAKFFAKLMLEDDYLPVREKLEELANE